MDKMEYVEILGRQVVALERIADALETRVETDRASMEMAGSFTDFIKLVIKGESSGPPACGYENWDPEHPPTVVDVPTYDPAVEDENTLYDLLCPNCKEKPAHTSLVNGVDIGREVNKTYAVCDDCHHTWEA